MTQPQPLSPSDLDELQSLIERLLENRLQSDDTARLEVLISTSPAHQTYYLNYITLHGMLSWDGGMNAPLSTRAFESGALPTLCAIPSNDSTPQHDTNDVFASFNSGRASTRYAKSSRPKKFWLAVSALSVLMLMVGYSVSWWNHAAPQSDTIANTTPVATHSSVELSTEQKTPANTQVQPELVQPNSIASANTSSPNHSPVKSTPQFQPIVLGTPDHKTPAAHTDGNAAVATSTTGMNPNAEAAPSLLPDMPAYPESSAQEMVGIQPISDRSMIALINRELAENWEDNHITPAVAADDSEWIRRVYLDLTGRIPTAEECRQFLENPSAGKRTLMVHNLLDSDEYSRHFATQWTALLVGRSQEKEQERKALNQYLAQAMARNEGWNAIFTDLLTSEGNLEENGATGFLLAHLNDMAVPATAVTCRLLLGEQLQCVQCHKHPYNEWTQDYFWEINSFFQQTKSITETVGDKQVKKLVNEPIGGPTYYETSNWIMKVAYPKLKGIRIDPGSENNRRKQFAQLVLTQESDQLAKAFVNRTWAMMWGYGFTNPVDDLGPHNPPSQPELLNGLAKGFIASGYDVRRLMFWICESKAYHLSTRMPDANSQDQPDKGDIPLFSHMYPRMMSPDQLYTSMKIIENDPSATAPQNVTKDLWIQRFVTATQTEENNEFDQFSGTATQALELMNGQLMDDVLSKFSEHLLQDLRQSRKNQSDFQLTDAQLSQLNRRLALATVSREPTQKEQALFKRRLEAMPATLNFEQRLKMLVEDVSWAYLNSSEFILIH
jgi:hypothetical protein